MNTWRIYSVISIAFSYILSKVTISDTRFLIFFYRFNTCFQNKEQLKWTYWEYLQISSTSLISILQNTSKCFDNYTSLLPITLKKMLTPFSQFWTCSETVYICKGQGYISFCIPIGLQITLFLSLSKISCPKSIQINLWIVNKDEKKTHTFNTKLTVISI